MFRLIFLFITTIYAALPAVREARSVDVSDSKAAEEIMGSFSLVGDSTKTPFKLQLIFENCNGLRDRRRGNSLTFTSFKLKYVKTQTMSWETINLPLNERGKNCLYNVEFYNDVQERYDIELWASFDKSRATAGNFDGKVSFNVLPKPKPLLPKKFLPKQFLPKE